jgi:WD40 repeat protein
MSVIGCEGNLSTGSSLVADLGSGEVIVSESGALGQDHTLAPDGTRFVRQEGENPIYGPLTIRDARTGDVIVELEGMCTWNQHIFLDSGENPPGCSEAPEPPFPFYAFELRWSPDGTMVAGVGGAGGLAFGVWDAVTGELLMAEAFAAGSAIFTPDGREIIIASGDERVGAEDGGVHLVRFDVESGDEIQNVALDDVHEMSFIGFSADGATLFIHDAPASFESGTLRAVSADGFEVVRSRPRVSDGSVKSNSLSGDGTRIALGSSDGFVRVWDAATFALVHEIFVGDTQVQGVAWVSDTQLAVAPEEGDIIVYTTDVGELLTIVRESVTRGFTEAECERFNFGNDCPSLASLRAGD